MTMLKRLIIFAFTILILVPFLPAQSNTECGGYITGGTFAGQGGARLQENIAQKVKDPNRFSVYVVSENNNGFVLLEVGDSTADIKKALSKKVFLIVDSPEQADMIITITGRYVGSQIVGSQTSVNRGIFGGLYATNTPIVSSWCYVFARVDVGNTKAALTVYGYGKWWRIAASGAVGYIEKWAERNYTLIRQSKGDAFIK